MEKSGSETADQTASTGQVVRPAVDASRLAFIPIGPDDLETLVAWLTTDTWPFHVGQQPTPEEIRRYADEDYFSDEHHAFWVVLDEASRVGLIRVEDVEDDSPSIDLRIRTAYRGRGIGTEILRWVAGYVFTTFPDRLRLEGTTRIDNLPMRRTFRRCGWVAEAYYRQAWPADDGTILDAICYAIIRDDWVNGTITPIPTPLDDLNLPSRTE